MRVYYRKPGWYKRSKNADVAYFWNDDQRWWTGTKTVSVLADRSDVTTIRVDRGAGMNPGEGEKRKPPTAVGKQLAVVGFVLAIVWVVSHTPSGGFGGIDVVYEVSGSAERTNITYESSTGISQETADAVPVTMHVAMSGGHFVSLIAQNAGSYGSITCKISVNGVVISSNTSRGGYSIATCSGTAS